MSMTCKERLIRAIRCEEVDRIPFAPFLAYYFDYLPADVRERGQLAYLEDMGADPLMRGMAKAYDLKQRRCTVTSRRDGDKGYDTISTPAGDLELAFTYVTDANTWYLTKHPVSTLEELYRLKLYFEDMEVVSAVDDAKSALDDIGERGLILPIIGIGYGKSCFQSMVEHWMGTENAVYLCYDHPDEVQETLNVMRCVARKTVEYTVMCGAQACISWEDSSTTNVSPGMYEQYIAPEISEWCDILRQHDVVYVQHACGLVHDLLEPMSRQGIGCVESITPYPTGNVDMARVAQTLPEHISIIGGIDPLMMLNDSVDQLEDYARQLIRDMDGRGFVLSNSDSCPPGVEYQKFLLLSALVKSL